MLSIGIHVSDVFQKNGHRECAIFCYLSKILLSNTTPILRIAKGALRYGVAA